MRENIIRSVEFGVAMTASYMAAVTMVQTTLFAKMVEKINGSIFGPLLAPYMPYFNLAVISIALFLCLSFWRKGDEVWFGRIFSLNMLMFFPAVLDFSTFNWVGLIFDLTPNPLVTDSWVFGVGLLLQITYLTLRYTVRFRYMREELVSRGAVEQDIDQVSSGQMGYLTILVVSTGVLTGGIYLAVPYINALITRPLTGSLLQPGLIGFIVILGIAASLILYLRGASED